MARAEVYSKWSTQGNGNRGGGGWSGPHGTGEAAHAGGGGIIPINQHAERVAWRAALPNIRRHVQNTRDHFANDNKYQIKIWVDQQVCPTCQKWMVIDVISHLKQLKQTYPGIKFEFYAEVIFANVTRNIKVQRSTTWPVEIGNQPRYEDFPVNYQ